MCYRNYLAPAAEAKLMLNAPTACSGVKELKATFPFAVRKRPVAAFEAVTAEKIIAIVDWLKSSGRHGGRLMSLEGLIS